MSTRSTIAIKNKDGKYEAVYCHFDGYPAGVGAQLVTRFNTEELVRELLAGGDLRAIPDQMEPEYYPQSYALRATDIQEMAQRNGSDYLYIFDPATSTWECQNYQGERVMI